MLYLLTGVISHLSDAELLHIGGKIKRILPVQLHIVRQAAATLYFLFDLKADGQDKIANLRNAFDSFVIVAVRV